MKRSARFQGGREETGKASNLVHAQRPAQSLAGIVGKKIENNHKEKKDETGKGGKRAEAQKMGLSRDEDL